MHKIVSLFVTLGLPSLVRSELIHGCEKKEGTGSLELALFHACWIGTDLRKESDILPKERKKKKTLKKKEKRN